MLFVLLVRLDANRLGKTQMEIIIDNNHDKLWESNICLPTIRPRCESYLKIQRVISSWVLLDPVLQEGTCLRMCLQMIQNCCPLVEY